MAETILYFILMIPVYGILIWTYFCPEDSMSWGQRWMYREEPEFSETAIGYTKLLSVIGIFFITFILVSPYLHHTIRLVLILGMLGYIIFRLLKYRKKVLDE
ncbi:hypothetical protein FIU87_13155 [Bacillus sp. THAF10]|uniref:hypothetical protein n=1 Tax=Bacillus sp. THAF10 TaxID=2587848 RepID=UPI0012A91360|nr:hypothetical protein [Bacillus sp. THAF10]QFT89602.1 hypothetical protein FIU87_13155 [Bacillus sp. THAF10]